MAGVCNPLFQPRKALAGCLLGGVSAVVFTACVGPAPAWQPVALPSARHGHRVEALPGGLLAFGGFSRGAGSEAECWWLPRGGDRWLPCAPMAVGRAFFASACVGGDVFALGDGVERIRPPDGAPQTLRPRGDERMPRSHLVAAAHEGRLFVLGGLPAPATGMLALDPATGIVTDEPAPPTWDAGDHLPFLVDWRGELNALGGIGGEVFTPRAEHWARNRDGTWRALPPPPHGLWCKFGIAAVLDGDLFVFTEDGGLRCAQIDGTWRTAAPMPRVLAMPAGAVVDGRLWVFGGLEQGVRARHLLVYDPAADRWSDLTPR